MGRFMTWRQMRGPAGRRWRRIGGGRLVVVGGKSGPQREAHAEVEAFDPTMGRVAGVTAGRHGTGVAWWGGRLCTASGSGNRGEGRSCPRSSWRTWGCDYAPDGLMSQAV